MNPSSNFNNLRRETPSNGRANETNCSSDGRPGFTSALKTEALYFRNKLFRGAKITGEPIFIVGCGHSGTSLLLAILSAHSKIFAVPYESRIAAHSRWRFRAAMRKFDRWTIAHGKTRWAEKTPKHILRIDYILQHRPHAKILLIIRDGRDVACSLQRRHGSLQFGIQRWVERNTEGKKFWRHPNVHTVRYESLISDFEKTMRQICAFIGEEYEPQLRHYYRLPKFYYSRKIEKPPSESVADHNQLRNWQINQPIFDTRGKWKYLSAEEKATLHEIGSDLLTELGYTDSREESLLKTASL